MDTAILEAAHAIRTERFAGAEIIFLAGSLVRGEGTAYSDLDVVVVYASLPAAYRQSFRFGPYPVEAFVHDPDTLEYFFTKVDRPAGIAALPQMVSEGVEIPGPTPLSQQLKARADEILAAGPPPLSVAEEQRLRYVVSDVLDDLRGVSAPVETVAVGAQMYEALANYYFRSQGLWSARGKAIPRYLARRDRQLASRYAESFELLFRTGNVAPVIAVAEEILQPKGGVLFEGYRAEAPATWRTARR
jgi:hypothetical protein